MRKIIVLTFVSLDGVMQAPGGPAEDLSNDFVLGGWTVPYFDESLGEIMASQMSKPFDLLLGRKTFEIFASYWPDHDDEGKEINAATKYVVSNTMTKHDWQKSVFINNNIVEQIEKLKTEDGPDIQVHGSSNLIQTLLKNNLVDEFWLKIFPVVLGNGKKLFGDGTIAQAYTLQNETKILPTGVIVANYIRAGKVKTGTFIS